MLEVSAETQPSKEVPKRADRVLSTVFRAALLNERSDEMCAGMTYPARKEDLVDSFDKLFGNTEAFDETETEQLRSWVGNVFTLIEDNRKKHFNRHNSTSGFGSPHPEYRQFELARLGPYSHGTNVPWGVVYLLSGEIKYQSGTPKVIKNAFDLTTLHESVERGTLGKVDPIPNSLINKVDRYIKGDEFLKRWTALDEERSYHPKIDLYKWLNFSPNKGFKG